MFIDYKELKRLFTELNQQYKCNNIDAVISIIRNFPEIDKLLNVVEIVSKKREKDYLYELRIANYYIGNLTSEFIFSTDKKDNKLIFLNYFLKYQEDSITNILRAILDTNIKVLIDNVDNVDLIVKTDVRPKNDKKEYLSDDLYSVDSYIYHSMYADNTFVGIDMIETKGYKSETDFEKEEDVFSKARLPLSKNTKITLANSMKRYNDSYKLLPFL